MGEESWERKTTEQDRDGANTSYTTWSGNGQSFASVPASIVSFLLNAMYCSRTTAHQAL